MNTNILSSRTRSTAIGAAVALALMLPVATHAAIASSPAAPKTAAVSATGGSSCGRVEIAPMVTIPVGKSSVIRPDVPVTRILLGNPDNAQAARPSTEPAKDDKNAKQTKQSDGRPGVAQVDVLLLSPNEIYLLGKSVGSTNVVLVDRSGGCTALDVTVSMDVTSVQGALAALLPNEKDIKVSSAYDSLVLSGTVRDATKVDRAVEIASAYVRDSDSGENGRNARVLNMLSVGAPQQVMLEVKVAEISKTLLDRYGINFSRGSGFADGTVARFLSGLLGGESLSAGKVGPLLPGGPGTGRPANGITTVIGSSVADGSGSAVAVGTGSDGTFFGIDAQKRDGLVKILAEPTVMAISGQEGSFLAGGKIFIPVAQTNNGGAQTITLEEKEFGVALKFTPIVLEGTRINLKVSPEVSELNREGIGISAPGVNGLAILPSFTTRRAATTVQLMDGQSFAIGGLIKNNVTTNIRAFPILGEIPVLGALFRSSDFQTDRSELVFVITPHLVKPLPSDYTLPTDGYVEPSRSDFFWKGQMEGTPVELNSPTDRLTSRPEARQGGFEPK